MTKEVESAQGKHAVLESNGKRASGADGPSGDVIKSTVGSSFWESKHPILDWDLQVSRRFFNWCQRSKFTKIIAEVFPWLSEFYSVVAYATTFHELATVPALNNHFDDRALIFF